MKRYGYFDMPDGYSDVCNYDTGAVCVDCGQEFVTWRENVWLNVQNMLYQGHCGCTETEKPRRLVVFVRWIVSALGALVKGETEQEQ